ncbi:MAG: DUF3140 domain-containing protein [Acidobacteriota bacterium]|nr:DUF3140 domain-containing protein [Acidobacteriota bacterium]
MEQDEKQALKEFKEAVNTTPKKLEDWLETEESKAVGYKSSGDDDESVGHRSGKRIVKLLQKKQADYTADDFKFMRKVVGYVHRHKPQKPSGDTTETNWRYSLMNWGHDPNKNS